MTYYYGVANGRRTGVYDNWDDCKEQVHGYSYNKCKKFSTPDKAWDFVDQHSSKGNVQFDADSRAVACQNNNQIARGNYQVTDYQRTDYTQGRSSVVVRERSYTSGRDGNGYFVEKYTRTYWKNN